MEEQEINTVKEEGTKPAPTMAKKVTFNKGPQTQKQSRLDAMAKKMDILALYIKDVEQSVQLLRSNLVGGLMEVYDSEFKDCRQVREDSISVEDATSYTQVILNYYKTNGEMVKIIPIEDGWKMTAITPDDGNNPKNFTVEYEFTGVIATPDYPTKFSAVVDNPYAGVMKLREHLFSLKEEKKIIM
jgi:hypothetical protein